jgi:UDP-N-acetylglucosamine 2-epimerase (non-hydrolysing)
MPEEYNRRVADHISHLLFAPTPDSVRILESEKTWGSIYMTGNTVIDACETYLKVAEDKSQVARTIPKDFILVTAHRAENVDDKDVLTGLVNVLTEAPLPVVYPLHPRTRKMLLQFDLYDKLASSDNVHIIPPAGYFDFLVLMKRCRFIITDSGGIQEEATSPSIRKRVIVFRKNTERPEAVDAGYATVVGTDAEEVASMIEKEVNEGEIPSTPSPYGDGTAGKKIARIVLESIR